MRWIGQADFARYAAELTNAHRVGTGYDEWVDRFGDDFLISSPRDGDRLVKDLMEWAQITGLQIERVFYRPLVKQPGRSDVPQQVWGTSGGALTRVVEERGLRFEIDFGAGYSVGLFCDQRDNRNYLESLLPARTLNCFAYTCAFSVAAARAGARTLSVDLAKRALDRGRKNFELNDLMASGRHRFFADDVFQVLPRLARRGERFDVVVVDPPTFSRGKSGRVFRAVEHFSSLVELAGGLVEDGGRLLLSTNSRECDAQTLLGFTSGWVTDDAAPIMARCEAGRSASVWVRR